ncbi:MAG TPA: hypothetical protein VNT53_05140 [Pseudolysinimonas sp.]|nr:hypothetical protein [Pseudolysinimonas sp.]
MFERPSVGVALRYSRVKGAPPTAPRPCGSGRARPLTRPPLRTPGAGITEWQAIRQADNDERITTMDKPVPAPRADEYYVPEDPAIATECEGCS